MKWASFLSKSFPGAFIFQTGVQITQSAFDVCDSKPQHFRRPIVWERSGVFDDQFERRAGNGGAFCCSRKAGDALDGNLSEKFQREMKLVVACPTGANVWKTTSQFTDVLVRLIADALW